MAFSRPDTPEGRGAQERAVNALLVGTTHLITLLDPDGTVAYVSPSVGFLLGYKPADVVGRNFAELMHPDDLLEALPALEHDRSDPDDGRLLTIEKDIPGEFRIVDVTGDWIPFEMMRNAMLADPAVAGTLVIGRQVRGRYALDDALDALAYDPDGIDAVRRIVHYLDLRLPGTESSVLLVGPPSEWIAASRRPGHLLAGRGPWDVALQRNQEVVARVGLGELDPELDEAAGASGYAGCWCVPLPVARPDKAARRRLPRTGSSTDPGGAPLGCLVVWSSREAEPPPGHLSVLERTAVLMEIALHRRTEHQRLRRLVDYDHVTGAMSRMGMKSIVSEGDPIPRAHLLVDLDNFKGVNDGHGHAVGDEVLRLAVKRVRSVLRPQDLVVRLGGDEFLILLAGAGLPAAEAAAQRVFDVLQEPINAGKATVVVGTSIGVRPTTPTPPSRS